MLLTQEQKQTLWASTLASFVTAFMTSAVNLALPRIAEAFRLGATTLGWTVTVYLLVTAVSLLPAGKLADLWGRKRVFVLGILLQLLGTSLAGFAFSGVLLIIFRAIQGIGGAMIFATSVALLTEVFPPDRRGEVLGINTAAIYLGLSLGPALGGILVQGFGWRSIFFLSLAPILVSLWVLLRSSSPSMDPLPPLNQATWNGGLSQIDLKGISLYTGAILTLTLGLTHVVTLWGIILFLIGSMLLYGFLWVERRQASPLLEVRLFYSNRVFTFSNLAALINYASTYAVAYLLSLYLQYLKGFPPRKAGLVLILQPFLQALCTPFAGKASDRVRPGFLASVGMGLTVVGLILCIRLDSSTNLVWVLGSLSLLGLGFGLFSSPNSNAIMGSVERKDYSVASATLATMRLLGQMLSMGITLLVFFLLLGDSPITPEVYPDFLRGLKILFGVFSVLNLLGMFASLARGR
ncbi:MAG: MFS transporter [Spirochaetes bacterium]|nr:MFS transporter [Spirochaetota bacterium]